MTGLRLFLDEMYKSFTSSRLRSAIKRLPKEALEIQANKDLNNRKVYIIDTRQELLGMCISLFISLSLITIYWRLTK